MPKGDLSGSPLVCTGWQKAPSNSARACVIGDVAFFEPFFAHSARTEVLDASTGFARGLDGPNELARTGVRLVRLGCKPEGSVSSEARPGGLTSQENLRLPKAEA